MASRRVWICEDCGLFSYSPFETNHYTSALGYVHGEKPCPGVPVEGVWAPTSETREGWLREGVREGTDRTVFVVHTWPTKHFERVLVIGALDPPTKEEA